MKVYLLLLLLLALPVSAQNQVTIKEGYDSFQILPGKIQEFEFQLPGGYNSKVELRLEAGKSDFRVNITRFNLIWDGEHGFVNSTKEWANRNFTAFETVTIRGISPGYCSDCIKTEYSQIQNLGNVSANFSISLTILSQGSTSIIPVPVVWVLFGVTAAVVVWQVKRKK